MNLSFKKCQLGFTLLEVMLVLLLMGLAAGYVVFNAFGTTEPERLEKEVRRVQVLVEMASDYAILNQQQLGLRVNSEDQSYLFMYLDEQDNWLPIEDNDIFARYGLPEPFTLTLELDDLPWQQEDQLFDREIFDDTLSVSDADVNIGDEPEPLPPPQVLILSSGDVTPFSLIFHYDPAFGNTAPAYFTLNNEDIPPLQLTGPMESLP